jgi:hypothetical protein
MENIKIADKTKDILKSFGYSDDEIKRVISNGTLIYEKTEFIRFFKDYMKEWNCDIEEIAEFKKMVETGECPEDWDIVEFDGKIYYLNICA